MRRTSDGLTSTVRAEPGPGSESQRIHRPGGLRPDTDPEVVLPILVGSTFARHLAGLPEDEAWLASMIDTVWAGIGAR